MINVQYRKEGIIYKWKNGIKWIGLYYCSRYNYSLTSNLSSSITFSSIIDVHVPPDPVVSVAGDELGTAGDELLLTCTVTVVDGLTVQPTGLWSGGSVGGDGVTESVAVISGNSNVRTLTFSPLLTSHGAQYTCQATINLPFINYTTSNSTDVFVQSM